MENKKVIYFITGLAAVGKTSAILPAIVRRSTEPLFLISTDALRPSTNYNDDYAWRHALELLKYHQTFSLKSNIFIEGVAFDTRERINEIQGIEKNNPGSKIKLAFVGSTRTTVRIEKPPRYYGITKGDVARSNEYGEYVREIGKSHNNYRFIDVIESVFPEDRRKKEPIELTEEDLAKNAGEVIKFLLS